MKNRSREIHVVCLWLLVGWNELSQVFGSAEDNEQQFAVKCGRDSAFHVCQTLGVKIDLDSIDHALGYKPVVTLAALRTVMEEQGLSCRSMRLDSDNADLVAKALREPGYRRSAIVALCSRSVDERHYVVLLDANPKTLTVWDAGLAQSFDVPFGGTVQIGAPLLLIGTDSSVESAINQRKSWNQLVQSVISSWYLAGGLAAVLVSWSLRVIASTCSNVMNRFASASVFAVQFRRLLAATCRPRTLLSLGVGGLLVFGIHHLIRIELSPLLADVSILELGAKPIGSVHTTSFHVKNRSLWRTCEIQSVRTSCSCLSPTVDTPVIPAGNSATISMKVIVLSGGNSEYAVLVTPSRRLPVFSVKIRYSGYEATRLTPAYFSIGGFPKGVAETKDVSLKVHNFEGRSVSIKVADTSVMSEGMTASVVGAGLLKEDGDITLRISCSGKRDFGTFLEKIMLTTIEDKPRSFLVTAHGHIVSPVTIQPNVLFLKASGVNDFPVKETLAIHSRVGALEFGQIDSNCDSLSARLLSDSNANGIWRIAVEYSGKIDLKDARIRISMRNPIQGEIEIPVYSVVRDSLPIPTVAE